MITGQSVYNNHNAIQVQPTLNQTSILSHVKSQKIHSLLPFSSVISLLLALLVKMTSIQLPCTRHGITGMWGMTADYDSITWYIGSLIGTTFTLTMVTIHTYSVFLSTFPISKVTVNTKWFILDSRMPSDTVEVTIYFCLQSLSIGHPNFLSGQKSGRWPLSLLFDYTIPSGYILHCNYTVSNMSRWTLAPSPSPRLYNFIRLHFTL